MGNSAKRDSRKAEKAERRRKALELRRAGASYEQIAAQLHYTNKGSVWRDVRTAIQDIYREPAQDVVKIELQRLDAMLLGLWAKAKSGDTQAIDRVLRIQERRAAYEGLDAPKALRVEVERELTRFLDRMREAFPPELYEQILAVAAGDVGEAAAAGAQAEQVPSDDKPRRPEEPG